MTKQEFDNAYDNGFKNGYELGRNEREDLYPDVMSLDRVDLEIVYITEDVERFEDIQLFERKTMRFFDHEKPIEYYHIQTSDHDYHIKCDCVKNFKLFY